MKNFISLSIMLLVSFIVSAQEKAKQEVLKLTTEYSEAIARRDAYVHNRLSLKTTPLHLAMVILWVGKNT